jgi:kinesin family protein 6/9
VFEGYYFRIPVAPCSSRGRGGGRRRCEAAAAITAGSSRLLPPTSVFVSRPPQRNTEIAILVNMLNKPGSSGVDALSIRAAAEAAAASCPPMRSQMATAAVPVSAASATSAAASGGVGGAAAASGGGGVGGAELFDTELLKDRNKAFEHFRRSYRKNEQIESTKMQLKAKYDEAQGLGESVRQVKNRISQMKALMEQRRVERAMQGLSGGGDDVAADPEEERMVATMERDRVVYKRDYERLRELKGEIEFMQMTLEKSRTQLTRDFESWFAIMERQAGGGGGTAGSDASAQSAATAPQPATSRGSVSVAKQVANSSRLLCWYCC